MKPFLLLKILIIILVITLTTVFGYAGWVGKVENEKLSKENQLLQKNINVFKKQFDEVMSEKDQLKQDVENKTREFQKQLTDYQQKEIAKNISINCEDELDIRCWNTYKNEEYGFEFDYLKQWNFIQRDIVLKEKVNVSIFLGEDINNKTNKNGFYIFPKGEFDHSLGSVINSTNLMFGRIKAIKNEYYGYSIVTFQDNSINNFFRIEMYYGDDNKAKEILNNILRTVRFI